MPAIETENRYPELSAKYQGALEGLIVDNEEPGITIFRGGPLDLRHYGIDEAWLTPLLVADASGYSTFHVIQINGSGQFDSCSPIQLNVASDLSLKLGDRNSRQVSELTDYLTKPSKSPQTIMRPSTAGNLAFPVIQSPLLLPHPDVILNRAQRAAARLQRELVVEKVDSNDLVQEVLRPKMQLGNLLLGKERVIETHDLGSVHVTPIHTLGKDPWKYYEIMSAEPIEDLDRYALTRVRVDSGCDIGECLHDGGCDCRFQMHMAIRDAWEKDSLVIHIPSQDGRGYGMAIKMATEGGKRGIDVGYNHGKGPMDTVTAATSLLGPMFDIRTYDGVATILSQLGFYNIELLTDSRKKFDALQNAGLKVLRIPTNTLENGPGTARSHIIAKHQNGDHYFAD